MTETDFLHPFRILGLFCDSPPKTSIMQMKLLEEEAMRHFPLMDAKARVLYVSNCIQQANKPNDDDREQKETR